MLPKIDIRQKRWALFAFLFFYILSAGLRVKAQEKQAEKEYLIRTIAFYNLENLFDTENDPFTFDDDRTPEGKDAWTPQKYRDKLKNISRVLSEIGTDKASMPPAVIGLCELENKKVLEDLLAHPNLEKYNYEIIHYESPDRRGIDVALIYQKEIFKPTHSESRRLLIYDLDDPSQRVFTRDQLLVSGTFEGELIHFIVNHWPSRSGGEARSSYKREKAAWLNNQIIDSLHQIDPYARIISMGDFNDDPTSKSIKKVLNTSGIQDKVSPRQLFNPMYKLFRMGLGTLAYRDGWNIFDQILLSQPFLQKDYSGYSFYMAGIFNPSYLITPAGQFRGYPYRSYDFGGYTGGYSDHFPVYVYLIKEAKQTSFPINK